MGIIGKINKFFTGVLFILYLLIVLLVIFGVLLVKCFFGEYDREKSFKIKY